MSQPPEDYKPPTYEGSRFPWWMVLYWVAFFVVAVIYLLVWTFPDLKLWLTDTVTQIWK